jgi:hypothetical protein
LARTAYPIPTKVRRILTLAIWAGLVALLISLIVLDAKTETASAVDLAFARLFGLCFGPVFLVSGLAGLALAGRPHHRKLVPLALAFIAVGGFVTWLFFFETGELAGLL